MAAALMILGAGAAGARTNEDTLLDTTVRSYEATTTVILHPVTTGENGATEELTLEIPAGSYLTEIETRRGADGVDYTRVGLDTDAVNLPSDFWLRSSELLQSGLRLDIGSLRGMTYCYRYVKLYLLKKGMVKVYLPGGSAWMAKNTLPKHGFVKVKRGPQNPKVNDVCVYSGGPSGHGHIEVRAPQGWYYGYGYSAKPISRNGRPLIACYAKR
ncbi:MAG: hypothetical protein KF802_04230 [Bdellovibrionaceae bacterium]|nr:hypothetical protein [Pseudobdellovibrionaceae bacterium]MBX3034233.1 hypothetical protein [Pseudobdellovibrionaceae bacterium]